MSATVTAIPVWKKNATPSEWLSELSSLSMESPENWSRIVVIFEKVNSENVPIESRWHSYGIKTNQDVIGTLEAGKMEVFEYMKGRR